MPKGPPSLVVRNKATRATLHLRGKHAKLHQASLIKFNNFIAHKYAFKTKKNRLISVYTRFKTSH